MVVRIAIVAGVVAAAVMIYAIIDLIMTDRLRLRAFNKVVWFVLILVLPLIGAVLWLVFGKARGDAQRGAARSAPDDDPEFLSGLERDLQAEERIRRLEKELSELDDDAPGKD